MNSISRILTFRPLTNVLFRPKMLLSAQTMASQKVMSENTELEEYTEDTLKYMLQRHKPRVAEPPGLTGIRHKMRGRFNITKTKWWLEQGPSLIPQVASINLEYNKPASDVYNMSKGAFYYHHYYIPQLRYKNPHVQIDVNTDQVAVPFMTIYFKDGRKALVNCASSSEEIAKHVQGTFCLEYETAEKENFDENGRIQNPWMHANNKPCRTSTKYRVHRKCICQQPGQYGCKTACNFAIQKPERKALDRRSSHNLPVEDNWYANFLKKNHVENNPRSRFNTYRFYRKTFHDMRPWKSTESFRSYNGEITRIEEVSAAKAQRKMKAHADFKLLKRLSQKDVHDHWSTYFWQCESGLSGDIEEIRKQAHLRGNQLMKSDSAIGGYRQYNSRDFFKPGPPYYA